jgi:hypothetical protein
MQALRRLWRLLLHNLGLIKLHRLIILYGEKSGCPIRKTGEEFINHTFETCFGVQLLASRRLLEIDDPMWDNIKQLQQLYDGDLYRYVSGCKPTLDEARELMNSLRAQGYPDAFTVIISNGEVTFAR